MADGNGGNGKINRNWQEDDIEDSKPRKIWTFAEQWHSRLNRTTLRAFSDYDKLLKYCRDMRKHDFRCKFDQPHWWNIYEFALDRNVKPKLITKQVWKKIRGIE